MDVPKSLDCALVDEQDLVSRYIGRKLSPEEAETFEEHYFGCERCWGEVKGATEIRAVLRKHRNEVEAIRPRPSLSYRIAPRWMLVAAAVVSAVLVAGILIRRETRGSKDGSVVPMSDLAAAVGAQRPVEGRLSGGFTWAEYSRKRGPSRLPLAATSHELLEAAAKIKKEAEENPGPEADAALGVTHLIFGEVKEAVDRLEKATAASDKSGQALSDLAAAYLELAERGDSPEAAMKALSVAERAIEVDPSLAEAYFNRAVALEKLGLPEEARAAWEKYLEKDPHSSWAQEARRRMSELPGRQGRSWDMERENLIAAAQRGDAEATRTLVERFPQETREWVEQEGLPAWAESRQRGLPALPAMDWLLSIAKVHAQTSGDPMLRDIVESVAADDFQGNPSALRVHLDGIRSFREGKTLLDRLESRVAAVSLEKARLTLGRTRNPLQEWAELYLAICLYYEGDFEQAKTRLADLADRAAKRGYRNLRARIYWLNGLVDGVKGEFAGALKSYLEAAALFAGTKEKGHQAAIESLAAEALDLLGETREGWRHRLKALALIDGGQPRRAHRVYSAAAMAVFRQDSPRAAIYFQQAALRTAPSWESGVVLAEAHLFNAQILRAAKRTSEAAASLARARQLSSQIQDRSQSEAIEAEISAEEGEVLADDFPDSADSSLTRAITYYVKTQSLARLPRLYLARGRCRASNGHVQPAESDFLLGIRAFEEQRRAQRTFRISYFDRSWELFDELVNSRVLQQDPVEALSYVERGRARDLLDRTSVTPDERYGDTSSPLDLSSIQRAMPPSSVLIYYALSRERLFVWLLHRDSWTFSEQGIASDSLARSIEEYRTVLKDNRPSEEIRRLSSSLFEVLIRPVLGSIPAGSALIFVPHTVLHGLPFGSLFDAERGRYLIEDHPVGVAPSGTMFLRACARRAAFGGASPGSLLVVANPRPGSTGRDLPELPHASKEAKLIADMYPDGVLLTGDGATPSRFLRMVAGRDVVHFAGHAVANPDHPQLARFVLAPESEFDDSGILFAEDIYGQKFSKTRLVVLAACGTATGAVRRAEGVLSLARPFLAAGVPDVVATLWDIEDGASFELLPRFHEGIRRGESALGSLRNAQLSMLRTGDRAVRTPAAWAAFEVLGASVFQRY
jgi:CHAT domain-containing protein